MVAPTVWPASAPLCTLACIALRIISHHAVHTLCAASIVGCAVDVAHRVAVTVDA